MVTEIIIYKLKKGESENFLKVFLEESLPMMKRWNVEVLQFGFSLDDKNTFHLLRNYKSLTDRNNSQQEFYNSSEWIDGPRKIILKCIENYKTTIFANI